jgi:glycosyltransferase involved in cell wall biosynthesis
MKVLMLTPGYGSDGWSRYASDLLEALRGKGVEARAIEAKLRSPLSYCRHPWAPLLDLPLVRNELERMRPDVLHVAVEPYALLLPFLPLNGIKVVLTLHGSYSYLPAVTPQPLRLLYSLWYRSALKKAKVLAVSQFTKSYFLRKLGKDVPVTIVPNSISLVEREVGGQKEGKTILTVAPIKARKGILEALRGVAAYVKKHGEVTYRIVGGYDPLAPESKKVLAEIKALGLEEIVTLVGRVSEEELAEEYQRASAFLMLPRVREPYFEGFGLVYLEANAYGVPVVASNEGGSIEAVKEGRSGYLVSADDAEAVADRLHRILNGEIAPSSARAWAEEHDSRRMVERVLEAYA